MLCSAAMGGNRSTDRFAKAVNQLETMKEYALAGKTCRHAQVSEWGTNGSADQTRK